jgi:hypothetical protein
MMKKKRRSVSRRRLEAQKDAARRSTFSSRDAKAAVVVTVVTSLDERVMMTRALKMQKVGLRTVSHHNDDLPAWFTVPVKRILSVASAS